MAMLPFCGYNMADYFHHWLELGRKLSNPPLIFGVNWFRRKDGKFLWPGYGENMRVLKWIVDWVHGRSHAQETPLGFMPAMTDLDWQGLELGEQRFNDLMRMSPEEWMCEIDLRSEFFEKFGGRIPHEFIAIQRRLHSSFAQAASAA
jgi:phosphoenolpyruvate carboxykinase (GTP)